VPTDTADAPAEELLTICGASPVADHPAQPRFSFQTLLIPSTPSVGWRPCQHSWKGSASPDRTIHTHPIIHCPSLDAIRHISCTPSSSCVDREASLSFSRFEAFAESLLHFSAYCASLSRPADRMPGWRLWTQSAGRGWGRCLPSPFHHICKDHRPDRVALFNTHRTFTAMMVD
jgi:hypothetical protein